MIIISNTTDFFISDSTAVAIGKFDGVHIGHRALLQEILEAKKKGYKAAVFTFDPSPADFFGLSDGKCLTDKEEKRKILKALGVDYLVEYPLDEASAKVEPETFIAEYLVGKMQAGYIVAGSDLSYGNRGKGDFALLRSMEKEYGYQCKEIAKIMVGEKEVSSTLIRTLVEEGQMEQVECLLGHPYEFCGKIMHGTKIGSKIGMPTINIFPGENKILPPFGVYYSKVKIEGDCFFGISNLGTKPTVNQTGRVNLETFLYDTEKDLYDKEAEISLLKFCRPEQKFSDLTKLQDKIREDVENGRKFFGINS